MKNLGKLRFLQTIKLQLNNTGYDTSSSYCMMYFQGCVLIHGCDIQVQPLTESIFNEKR